jgi:hypothetical protein
MVESGEEGVRRLEAGWRSAIDEPVDVVWASIGRHRSGASFNALARAAAMASRVVKPDGAIVILTESEPVLEEGMEMLRQSEDISKALKVIGEKKPNDRAAVFQWLAAATHARLYLASGLRPDLVEELFATPLLSPSEAQRLLDQGGVCLDAPDAEKRLIDLAP